MKTARELLTMALTWEGRGNAADQDAMQGLHEDVYPVRIAIQDEMREVRDYLSQPGPEPDGWVTESYSKALDEWVRDGVCWVEECGPAPAAGEWAPGHRHRHIYLSSPDYTAKSPDHESPDVNKADSVCKVD